MRNLLQETLDCLEQHCKKESDVLWVGADEEYSFTWETFKKLADKKYDASCGCAMVHMGLIVVGKDWWLERGEYDGSEWWEFKTYPQKPKLINDKPKFI